MDETDVLDEERRVERAMAEVSGGADEPMEVDIHPDRTLGLQRLGLSRMRTRWNRAEAEIIGAAKAQAEREMDLEFADVWRLLNRLYEIVREPIRDPATGEPVADERGHLVWARDSFGMYVEDWSKLTDRHKEEFLHQITTRLVLWEQQSADMWAEAMYSKGLWEERFASSFVTTPAVESKRPTEADRTQHAQLSSREQRYMAIYMSVRSRKADALVKSMDRLALRLRDTYQR